MDSFVTLVLLNVSSTRGAAYRAASFINLATGEQLSDAVPASHWQQVAAAMAVTTQQRQKLSIMLQQSTRYRQRAWAQQSNLCDALADDTARKLQELRIKSDASAEQGAAAASATADAAAAALAAAFGVSNQASASAAAPAAAAAVSTATEATLHKMQGTLWGLTTSIQVLLAGALNVLSRLQLARMLVAAYPHLPHITAGACCPGLLVTVLLH
jgi:predicted phage tail protein